LEQEAPKKKVWDKTNSWGSELELLREIIAETPLIATTKWGGEVYTSNGKNIIGIAGFKNFFTIWFFKGAQLKDEKKVLINAQEGKTKLMRQWRFTAKEQIDKDLILQYIQEAIAIENSQNRI
jgi:uncharacterized protein YdeI (YjbR/CyaY-like superfamily)